MATKQYTTYVRTRDALGRFHPEPHVLLVSCRHCGTPFRRVGSLKEFCSRECNRQGASQRYVTKEGYVRIKLPEHPHATTNGWVFEHIVVMTATLGRVLLPNECVHHKDHNKQNNHPDNLEVLDRAVHAQGHGANPSTRRVGEENPLILCACGCDTPLSKYDIKGRPRRYVVGHTCRNKLPAKKGHPRLPKKGAY